jgi:hypothetical protein
MTGLTECAMVLKNQRGLFCTLAKGFFDVARS